MNAISRVAPYADEGRDEAAPGGRWSYPHIEVAVRDAGDWSSASGYAPRRNPVAIGLVVAAHCVGLWALIHFDMVSIGRHKPQSLAVTMVEVAPPPPPHAPSPPRTATPKATVALAAPPPVIALAAPAPPPLIVAPPAPAPAPITAPAPPVVATVAPLAPAPVNLMADLLDAPAPRFPAESRRLRESGTVRLRLTVSAEGRVSAVEVARSSGFDRLDQAAADAVRRWRFRPRLVGGVATEVIGFVPVTFNPPH